MSGNPNSHISQHVDLLELQLPSATLPLLISSKLCPCGIELTVLGSDHFSSWHLEVGSRKGIFNHVVPSASSPHQFGASFSSSAVSSSTVLSLNPLQAVASTSSSSFPPSSSNLVTSSETRPAQHLNRAPVQSVFHPPPPPPNVSLPPPPPLLASNSEPALLQNLPSIPPGETFLPSSSAPVQSNSSLSIKLASLQHKPSRPSFTVHHPPLPRVLPQPNAAGTAAMWVTLGMQPPYASHLSGTQNRRSLRARCSLTLLPLQREVGARLCETETSGTGKMIPEMGERNL
ncbi:hypothetical protein Nmel_018159 [Mimus melanotis]